MMAIALRVPYRPDLYTSGDQMEKANQQYVSGSIFCTVGLRPAFRANVCAAEVTELPGRILTR